MMNVLASLGRAATSSIAVVGQKRKQSTESEEKELNSDGTRDLEETKQTGESGKQRREDDATGEPADSKEDKQRAGAAAAPVGTEKKKQQRQKPPKRQKKENAPKEQKEKDSKEEKEDQQEKKSDSTRESGSASKDSRNKRRVSTTATESPNKRLEEEQDDHDMVPAGEIRPLHPRVLEFLPLKNDTARLRRAHTEADGSCMLNAFLMGMANGVHPTSDAVQTLRRRLRGMIEGLTKEAWASLGEHDGQCSTPQQYTQRFLSQPDAFLDRSILHFCLQLEDALPPHPLPSLVYCITVQPLFPDAQVEESDDISVRILNKADTAIRVHKYGQQPMSLSAPADCIVLYQQWGATVSKHVELVVHNDPPLARFPHDHPFIVALDKHVSTRSDQIEFARNNSFVCTPLQGWTFPCLLDVDFLPAPSSSSSTHGSPTYSKLPVVQRILTTVRRDLDRSDRRFLRYLVALSHISQMRNADKREEEYNKIVFFLDEYEPCNMPIVLGCIVISFFIYATPHVGKWFHAQKRVTLKMLASCPAPLVRDEYRLNLLFLHLMHTKALMKRDDITALAAQLIAEDDIPTKGGWDIDKETYEFTFHVIHTTGKVKEDERVLKHERAWWSQSKLQEDKHWKEVVETTIKAVRLLTIKELGNRGRDGGPDSQLRILITGDPQHPRWWTRDQILRHKIKQWKEKLDEFEAQTEEKAEDEEKAQPAVDKDRVIQQLRAEIAKEKAAYENEKIKREKAEHALKKRVDKEREQVNKAKEALAAERDEIEKRKQQLDKQQAKINDWLRDHPEAANVVGV